jgi:hypothetical protein
MHQGIATREQSGDHGAQQGLLGGDNVKSLRQTTAWRF